MHIPQSVLEYYGDRSRSRVVDILIQVLDGERALEVTWEDACNYGRALLSAAQTRADYMECLFGVWEDTFGCARPERLQGGYFEWSDWTPQNIWTHGRLRRCYYRGGNPADGGPSDGLGVVLGRDGGIRLFAARFDANDEILEQHADGLPDGWSVRHYARHGDHLLNRPAKVEEIHADRSGARERLVRDAQAIVNHLVCNPPA